MSTVAVYVMAWHLYRSPAVRIVFEQPLAHALSVSFHDRTQYQPDDHPADRPLLFVQQEPPLHVFDKHRRVVWAPMWDYAATLREAVWERLPKFVRVIAFTDAVAQKAQRYGLKTLRVQFFLNPDAFAPVDWSGPRTLFYWNRKALFTADFLERLCETLAIERLYFRDTIDPNLPPELHYMLPEQIGGAQVVTIPDTLAYEQYLAYVRQAQVFLAPRELEGIGVTFLEAMVSGSVVFGMNQPTMSDYITHAHNGYLLPVNSAQLVHNRVVVDDWFRANKRLSALLRYRMRQLLRQTHNYGSPLATNAIDWDAIGALSLVDLGQQARRDHVTGYARWQKQLPQLIAFLTDW